MLPKIIQISYYRRALRWWKYTAESQREAVTAIVNLHGTGFGPKGNCGGGANRSKSTDVYNVTHMRATPSVTLPTRSKPAVPMDELEQEGYRLSAVNPTIGLPVTALSNEITG